MKLSHPEKEGNLQASKWLSCKVLLDTVEMQSLFDILPEFNIYNVSEVVSLDNASISIKDFLTKYIDYITNLKAGVTVNCSSFKSAFSCAFSSDASALYAMKVKKESYIIKPIKPIVQINFHHFLFSSEEHKFYSMVHSKDSVPWGLQFSFPQIYCNSSYGKVVEVFKDLDNSNTQLFKKITGYVRKVSKPVPFKFRDQKIYSSFRLGEKCFNWIDCHPDLKNNELTVQKKL